MSDDKKSITFAATETCRVGKVRESKFEARPSVNTTLRSFKELMKDCPGGMKRKETIAAIKNIQQQSFCGSSVFESEMISQRGKCSFIYAKFPNQITPEEHHQRGVKARYSSKLSGVVIPLETFDQFKARLVIACPEHGVTQISVEILMYPNSQWINIPARTNTVSEIIYAFVK